eukprot:CAMPEP_0170520248 /NCGR_PEP_ID=MMETSP0209-20121228/5500_1 /TAXON_ID=665100 ORGANISM="Litonotus pictus, Strain P1" /NCGR_SAMPLE_ID=MMETSP0209 /ASSEMBLY_ACC=CAM_ASM_000301 /LENGTH=164 /DNA_ID=CAMNT_0010806437 /DNA_START=123 /DNA_END=614 /DNA_ORIENTATION=-
MTTSFNNFHYTASRDLLASKVEVINYGNAKELSDSKPNDRKFRCQHGEKECVGNTIENCAQDILGEYEGDSFTICFMGSIFKAGKEEADLNSITAQCSTRSEDILACSNSTYGQELVHKAATRTGDHTGVPFVLINGKQNDQAVQNLTKFLCEYNNLVGKVQEC